MASLAPSVTSRANLLDNHPKRGPSTSVASTCIDPSGGAASTSSASLTPSASTVQAKPHIEEQFYRFNPYCATPRVIVDPKDMFTRMIVAALHSSRAAMVLLSYDAEHVCSPYELYSMRHCSYSSVRLQFLIRQRFPNTYEIVVTGDFGGKWHLLLQSIPGLTTFTYTAKEIASNPDMQWLLASDEMRVSDRDKASSVDSDAVVSAWVHREILCNDLVKFVAEALDFVASNTKWDYYVQVRPTIWRVNAVTPESRTPPPVDCRVRLRVAASELFRDPSWLLEDDSVSEGRVDMCRRNAAIVELVFQTIDPETGVSDVSGEVLRLSTEFLSDRFEKQFPVLSGTLSRVQLRRYTRQCVLQVVLGKDRAPPMHPANQGKDPASTTRELGRPNGSVRQSSIGTERGSGEPPQPKAPSVGAFALRGEGNTVAVPSHTISTTGLEASSATATRQGAPHQSSSLGHIVSLLSFASNVFSKRSGVVRRQGSLSSTSSSSALLASFSLSSLPDGGGAPGNGALQLASDQAIIPQLAAMG